MLFGLIKSRREKELEADVHELETKIQRREAYLAEHDYRLNVMLPRHWQPRCKVCGRFVDYEDLDYTSMRLIHAPLCPEHQKF